MAIQKYTSNNQENVGFPKGKWMVTEDDHLAALREQRVGIAEMVREISDLATVEDVYQAILDYQADL